MPDNPNPNLSEPKKEIPGPRVTSPGPTPPGSVGGDHIIIQGNVGPGASVGSGSVTADYIAQGDITINNGGGAKANSPEQFVELLADLRALLEQAKEKGELDPLLAGQAIKNLDTAVEMVSKEQKPPKPELLKRLEAVAQMIDAAVDMLTQDGSVGSILLKALPVAVMLVKLATHLF